VTGRRAAAGGGIQGRIDRGGWRHEKKRMFSELWEKYMRGKGLFMIAEKNKDELTVREQIIKNIYGR
jgi:hypothetical protein